MELQKNGIPEYFAGKSIFITGGNGFMGKVLIEKILRSCKEIGKIYILIREKSAQSSEERVREFTSSPVFDKIRLSSPDIISTKLIVVVGSLTDERLGINETSYEELKQNVNIIVHLAASIRFNDPLSFALKVNLMGTKRVIDLASHILNLEAFVHVSTAYSNCNHREVKEIHYEPSIKWDKIMSIMERTDTASFEILAAKILDDVPNTYTFSKALAENLVWDQRHKLPIILMRPSIVISCWTEPIPGWTDSLFGVVGMMFGAAKGVIRVVYNDPNAYAAYIPVDTAAKATLAAIWYKNTHKQSKDEDHIYNLIISKKVSNKSLVSYAMEYIKENPLRGAMFEISVNHTTSWFVFLIQFYFKQLLPALFIDLWLIIIGRKPRVLKIQKKFFKGMGLIGWFLIRSWIFRVDNFTRLENTILLKDREEFSPNMAEFKVKNYLKSALDGGRVYLLKEPLEKSQTNKLKTYIISWLENVIWAAQISIIGWLMFKILL